MQDELLRWKVLGHAKNRPILSLGIPSHHFHFHTWERAGHRDVPANFKCSHPGTFSQTSTSNLQLLLDDNTSFFLDPASLSPAHYFSPIAVVTSCLARRCHPLPACDVLCIYRLTHPPASQHCFPIGTAAISHHGPIWRTLPGLTDPYSKKC